MSQPWAQPRNTLYATEHVQYAKKREAEAVCEKFDQRKYLSTKNYMTIQKFRDQNFACMLYTTYLHT